MSKQLLSKIILVIIFFFKMSLSYSEEYFMTLRNEKVNLRQGPSFEYPIKLFYKKKYLPVKVQDSYENFRKITDHQKNNGWIHISQLAKKKAALANDGKVFVFKRPSKFSKPKLIMEKGKLCLVLKCKNEWCKIKVNNFKGWVLKEKLWGRI